MLRKFYTRAKHFYYNYSFPYSPSSRKNKIIFIHVPKTAGTAIRLALGEPQTGRRHLPWWVYQQASPKRFNEYFKFGFVRNPITRVFSGYNYLKLGGNKMNDLLASQYIAKYKNFSEFVEEELKNGTMLYHPIFRPQSWYLCDWKGDLKVDYLGYIETIDKDFSEIIKAAGLKDPGQLALVNSSSRVAENIDEEVKNIIYKVYRHDFELFGYCKNEN